MAQHDYTIANQGFPAFRSDLNDALAAIVSNNSGATEPTTMFAHQVWVDTAANPSILKIRNADNDAWITIGSIDQTGDTFTLTSAVSATTLNTSGAVVFNDAGADVDFRVEGDTDANLLFVDASADKVGIGTSTPVAKFEVSSSSAGVTAGDLVVDTANKIVYVGRLSSTGGDNGKLIVRDRLGSGLTITSESTASGTGLHRPGTNILGFSTNAAERMRISSAGHVGIATTGILLGFADQKFSCNGTGVFERSGNVPLAVNRLTSDGDIVRFYKDTTTVGSIGATSGQMFIVGVNYGFRFNSTGIAPADSGGTQIDNAVDLGAIASRFDDIYATNGTIQTSDANEKQDIEALSEAETRVAVAAKGLLKKYRWKSAVAEKGDDARIHFGIIAQDLKAAFEAEGLDAHRYGMFMWNEWWEHDVDVPAVEAQEAVYETQTDEEGNEVQVLVSEAVEGKDAYTRTDTYETEAEAPEGAVRKERMGVRYNELLAFIIAAI